MSSLPNDNTNLSMSAKLQKILVEGTKDVKFIFELNGDNSIDNGPPAPQIARYGVDGSSNAGAKLVTISAHKKVLAASSKVFNAMFYGALKESGNVKITDVSFDAFREFLQIFYNDEVLLTMENLGEVMKLIDKYDVEAGWPVVDRYFKLDIRDSDILWGLHLVVKFQRDNLIAFCQNAIKQNITSVYEMIKIDNGCQPKLHSNPNNRPMSDADLANIFPLIWKSIVPVAGIVKLKLFQSIGMINGIDQVEDLSFTSFSKVLLTHLTYPAIYTYNQKHQLKSWPYDVEVTITNSETEAETNNYHKVPWNGGTIKLSTPVLIQPYQKYTIETKFTLNFSSKPLIEVYKTPAYIVRLGSNIQINCETTHYSCVAAVDFVRCDE